MPRHNVIVVNRASRVRKLRSESRWPLASPNADNVALRDYSRLPDGPRRIRACPSLFIHVVQHESTEAPSFCSRPHSILRVTLNYAVGNPQSISALPVNSIACALHGNVEILYP